VDTQWIDHLNTQGNQVIERCISLNRICKSRINNDVGSKDVNSIFVEENVNVPSRCKSVEKGRIYLLFLDYTKTNYFAKDAKTS
jgi:hypothetical protein